MLQGWDAQAELVRVTEKESEGLQLLMDVDIPQHDPLARPANGDGIEGKGAESRYAPPPKGVPPMPGMMPPMGPIPPMMMMFPPPGMMPPPLKKKKWADAPKEFPKEGEGYPFPQGGWAYCQSIQKPYDFQRTDDYQERMKEAGKRTTLQLAFTYLLDVVPGLTNYVDKLSGEEIRLVHSDDALDVTESIVGRLFKVNNIRHIAQTLNQLDTSSLVPKQHVIVLDDTLHVEKVDDAIALALRDFVSNGGTILSFNNAISVIALAFPGKLKPRLGATTLDKPMEIKVEHFDNHLDRVALGRYQDKASEHRQMVRLHGLQRFEVIDADNQVQVLITETAPQPDQPLLVKLSSPSSSADAAPTKPKGGRGSKKTPQKQAPVSSGAVYHGTTTHLVAKVGEQGRTSFQPLSDMLPVHSKALAQKCIEDIAKTEPLPASTITAWKAALQCGFAENINVAVSYQPFLHYLFTLLMAATSFEHGSS